MMLQRILVVDDEPQIQRFLKPALIAAGFDVETAGTAAEAKRLAATRAPALIVLDLGLPDGDGKTVIETVRAFSSVPIIVLSARDQEIEKIAALDLGANDYVEKPFGIGELLARIRVALRHAEPGPSRLQPRQFGNITLDHEHRRVLVDNLQVHLTPKEFDLFELLAANANKVVTHRQALTQIWGPAHQDDAQYLRVVIGQLRAKLEFDARSPKHLLSEPGVGYRLIE
ncbi:response regulator [Devosia psychrophila]|uniref:Transcriptional regulator n=2 Tax=Devosia psychrophila TaxID=728005 RepID=A0ABR5DTT7_9HYPH|nr:response regulator [Devosia psychrophila]KKC31422.1 transcriptional regulator [Devosia psychrophila]